MKILPPTGSFCLKSYGLKRLKRRFKEVAFIRLLVCTALILVPSAPAFCDGIQAWLENGTRKIRQDIVPESRPRMEIKAARNEFEPFQLVIKNTGSAEKKKIDVSISDFTGSGTISNKNVTIFKEAYLDITNLSSIEGKTGEWPDALLPKVDAYYHETRSTFPLSISAGRVQPIWFDVFVPEATAPGEYTATVTVTENAVPVYTATVLLTVWDFTLPATSSLPSYFICSPDHVWQGFSGEKYLPSAMIIELQRLFIKAGLRHRLSLSPYRYQIGKWNGTAYDSFSRARRDESLAGYIDGTSGDIEYGPARLTGFFDDFSSLYKKYVVAPGILCRNGVTEPPVEYLAEVKARAELLSKSMTREEKEKTYFLLIDEAGGGEVGCGKLNRTLDFNTVKAAAQILHNAGLKTRQTNSRTPNLLNTAVDPPRNDYIDRWVSAFTAVVGRDWRGNGFDKSADYKEDIVAGKGLWWYQGCGTGGCGITGGAEYNGNPQYMVEYSAMHARIFPWMIYKYGVQGEMYWSVAAGFGKVAGYPGDPYYSVWSRNYKKNGDGMLFYPGVADTTKAGLPADDGRGLHTPSIGGTHDIPIESIRLKMIREGYEDYEYLKILADLGDEAYARSIVNDLVTTTYQFAADEKRMYSARERLANRITKR